MRPAGMSSMTLRRACRRRSVADIGSCDGYRDDTAVTDSSDDVMASHRVYRHFCMGARALEVIGERWSLLIVRDLLLGPRRFTDLIRGLDEITPTRLTGRLRQLEAAGVVRRESSGGREVWYRLTDEGLDLAPAIDALTLWGIEHAREPPRPGEPVHPEPVMIGTKVWLNRFAAPPAQSLTWVWRFPGPEDFTLRFAEGEWRLARGNGDAAAVTAVASVEAWAKFLSTPRERRRLPSRDIKLEGRRAEVRKFAKAFATELARDQPLRPLPSP
jgi:DNA-binding HxlR family transcriptional regulator